MIYMKKGGMIRLCDECTAERLKAMGFQEMSLPKPGRGEKGGKKPPAEAEAPVGDSGK